MIWLYNILITLFSPLWVPWLILRARRRKEQPNWKERQGDLVCTLPKDSKKIWVHAVSVGEVVAALPLLKELKSQRPDLKILLSVTTSSGHEVAQKQAVEPGLADQLVYFPIDVVRFVLASLARVKPQVVVIMETELWFNFLWAAKSVRATTMLVNGRLSDRSFPRAKNLRWFYRSLFQNLDHTLVQSPLDAERFQALGAHAIQVLGNTKFDEIDSLEPVERSVARERLKIAPDARVVVVGSTRGAEEQQFVLDALKALPEDVQIIFAPRHLETVDVLAQQATATLGQVAFRSKGEQGRFLILDTYGELAWVYAAADIAVVGGGFLVKGGQNIIQPMAHGVPVIRGSQFENFRAVADLAEQVGASLTVRSSQELAESLVELLQDQPKRDAMAEAARELVSSQRGASKRYAEMILKHIQ